MFAIALGHQDTVKALMEHSRAGHLRINLQARDNSDYTALDYAKVASYYGARADERNARGKSARASKPSASAHNTKNKLNVSNTKINSINKNNGISYCPDEEIEMSELSLNPAVRNSNLTAILQFAREIKDLRTKGETNLATLSSEPTPRSKSTGTTASRSTTPLRSASSRSRSQSLDRTISRAEGRAESRLSAKPRGSPSNSEDDDDLDLDLSSLRDLMGTVREAAREIREIVEPINKSHKQSDQKHKAKKDNTRSRQSRRTDHQQQIQAEVHVISEINGRVIPPLPPPTPAPPRTPTPTFDSDDDTNAIDSRKHQPPTAFLRVENEELSRTWPRGKGRSVSRERTRSSGSFHGTRSKDSSVPRSDTSPLSSGIGFDSIPKFSTATISANAVQSEREILQKVFGRMSQVGGADPLVAAINSNSFTPKARLITESRQRIVDMARDHWSVHQPSQSPPPPPPQLHYQRQPQSLPHITVTDHVAEDNKSPGGPNLDSKPGFFQSDYNERNVSENETTFEKQLMGAKMEKEGNKIARRFPARKKSAKN